MVSRGFAIGPWHFSYRRMDIFYETNCFVMMFM